LKCMGEGIEQCNLGHTHECPDCNGRGHAEHERGPALPTRLITTVCAYTELSAREVYILLRVAELLEQPTIKLTHCSFRGASCFMVGPARVYILPQLIDNAVDRLSPLIPQA